MLHGGSDKLALGNAAKDVKLRKWKELQRSPEMGRHGVYLQGAVPLTSGYITIVSVVLGGLSQLMGLLHVTTMVATAPSTPYVFRYQEMRKIMADSGTKEKLFEMHKRQPISRQSQVF